MDRLILFVVFISDDEVGKYFLDFVCDEPVFVLIQKSVIIHHRTKSVKCGDVRCRGK